MHANNVPGVGRRGGNAQPTALGGMLGAMAADGVLTDKGWFVVRHASLYTLAACCPCLLPLPSYANSHAPCIYYVLEAWS